MRIVLRILAVPLLLLVGAVFFIFTQVAGIFDIVGGVIYGAIMGWKYGHFVDDEVKEAKVAIGLKWAVRILMIISIYCVITAGSFDTLSIFLYILFAFCIAFIDKIGTFASDCVGNWFYGLWRFIKEGR